MFTVTRTFILLLLCTIGGSTVAQDACVWRQKASMPTEGREGAGAFAIGDYGYVVAGFNYEEFITFTDLWRYDAAGDTWSQMADFPGAPRESGVSIVIDGKAYYGLGRGLSGRLSDWWQYDPATNAWTQMSNYPLSVEDAVGFVIGGTGYVGTGYLGFGIHVNSFYAYDPIADTWTAIANYPMMLEDAAAFSLNGYGYVAGGVDFTAIYDQTFRYDPAADTWTGVAPLPLPTFTGVFWSANGMGFVGLGNTPTEELSREVFMYNPDTDTWTAIAQSPVIRTWTNESFSIGGKGYVVGGSDWDWMLNGDGYGRNDVWEYSCGSIVCNAVNVESFTQGSKANGSPVSGGHSNSNNALTNGNGANAYVSLGFGGSITLRMDHVLYDRDGCDLLISEASNQNANCANNPEKAKVEVSLEGDVWTEVGTVCMTGCVDIAGAGPVQYVRVTDVSNVSAFNTGSDGYDLVGVSINGCGVAARMELPSIIDTKITLYPNPAETNITVQLPEGGGELLIVNALGQTVYAQSIENEKALVDVSQLASGVYQVRFDNGGVQTLNFVKQ